MLMYFLWIKKEGFIRQLYKPGYGKVKKAQNTFINLRAGVTTQMIV